MAPYVESIKMRETGFVMDLNNEAIVNKHDFESLKPDPDRFNKTLDFITKNLKNPYANDCIRKYSEIESEEILKGTLYGFVTDFSNNKNAFWAIPVEFEKGWVKMMIVTCNDNASNADSYHLVSFDAQNEELLYEVVKFLHAPYSYDQEKREYIDDRIFAESLQEVENISQCCKEFSSNIPIATISSAANYIENNFPRSE